MRKSFRLLSTVTGMSAVLLLAACGSGNNNNNAGTGAGTGTTDGAGDTTTVVEDRIAPLPVSPADFSVDPSDPRLAANGLDENLRFIEPRTISVALWDRSHDRIPNFNESHWAQWVEEKILEDHNIIVNWVPVPRWSEDEFQATLLGGNQAPDIGYTFQNPMVSTFANMGGILDMTPLLDEYRDWLPNLYDLLTPDNVYFNLDPDTNELFSLTGRLVQDGRLNTFIREDWLNTLGLPIPTTLEEFEDTLIAFRDNAEVLLGADADRMIPFQLGHDVGWTGGLVFESFIPNDISERDWFIRGFDDRRFMHEDAIREGARVLNRWFNEDLLWRDFVLHPAGDPIGDDQIRLGFVGSFIQNWDLPFRAADAFITNIRENVGPEANYIVITPFVNDAGQVRNIMPQPTDRFIFFPHTNTEPLASLIYLDWISRLDVREYLQFGVEGVHRFTHPDGSIEFLGEDDDHSWPDYQFIPSLRNFDITMTVNGIDLGDYNRTVGTLALGFPGISPEAVMQARDAGMNNAYRFRQVSAPPIVSEEGMNAPLNDQRDVLLHQVIAATSPEDFDATFDRLYQNYLNLGAQAIMNEREAVWISMFGDVDRMP